MNSKVQWKNCKGTDWNNMPSQTQEHMAAPSLRIMPSVRAMRRKGSSKTHDTWDSSGSRQRRGWAIRTLSGAKCQHHASQNPPSVRRNSSSSKRQPDRVSQKFRVELVMCSHATGRLILPCGVSTDSPRHQTFKCCHALSMSTGSNISQRAGNIGCCIPGEESNTRKIHSFKF
jgi:hypothetical protein